MPFTDFKTPAHFVERFRIKFIDADFVEPRTHSVSDGTRKFLSNVEKYFGLRAGESGLGARVIFPVLAEVYWPFASQLGMMDHEWFGNEDPLCGVPDYVLGQRSSLIVDKIDRPFVPVVEAKKDDFDAGWGQCGAAMLAAQKINEDPQSIVYGVVTNGRWWNVGKLQGTTLTVERRTFALVELDQLCAALRFVFEQCVAQVQRYAPAA